jgi:hypothetical protein
MGIRDVFNSGFLVYSDESLLVGLAVIATGGNIIPGSFRQAALNPFRKHGSTNRPIYHQPRPGRFNDRQTYQSEEDTSTAIEEIVNTIEMKLIGIMNATNISDMKINTYNQQKLSYTKKRGHTRDEPIDDNQCDWIGGDPQCHL